MHTIVRYTQTYLTCTLYTTVHACMKCSCVMILNYTSPTTIPTFFTPPGYARLSNVEFVHSGQLGFVASVDARFSVTFFDIGKVSAARQSYVTKSTFHHGFSPAVGVFKTHDLEVANNIIHHTVGPGMYSGM